MKFLIPAMIFLSVDAQQAQPAELKTENFREEMAEMKMKMARVEYNVADIQQTMIEIMSLLKPGGKISEGLVVPEKKTETNLAEHLEEDVSIITGEKSDSRKMNDTDLEQRVQMLEFQMTTVIDDVTTLTDDVTDLEDDVDTQLKLLETDINLIQVDQNTQDANIFDLEDRMVAHDTRLENLEDLNLGTRLEDLESLNLDTRLEDLESLNLGTRLESLESLNLPEELDDLDSRLERQEISGIIAFHVFLLADVPIPEGTPVIFERENFNYGLSYNIQTGEFTTPPGGDGLYYFYFHFEGFPLKRADLVLRKNTSRVCDAINGRTDSNDWGTVGCGALVHLNEGDKVDVFNMYSTEDTIARAGNARTTFSGFRVAPE